MMVKRAVDVVLGAGLALLTAPLVLLGGVWVRISMGAPVLFSQRRPGLNGAPFTMYKLRTMRDEAFVDEPDEARLTPAGKLLRSTSVDELPELWNVLKGDMSLVGPRPLLMEYLPLYSENQARRHEVKPGVTGLAQVMDRNDTTWERRLALDVWYVDHWSVWLDLRILAMTVRRVLLRTGISAEGEVTMAKFEGTSE